MRLGILTTHPIQYHAPLYRRIAGQSEFDLRVYFCQDPNPEQQGVGFGIPFKWDVGLTSGYTHEWLRNVALAPSLTSFWGCNTPALLRVIRKERFDAFLVHGWNNLSCWQAFWACWRTRTPLLVRGDSQLRSHNSRLTKLIKDLVYPTFIRRFDVCIAMGTRSAEYFRHFRAKRIVISPHFVDNAWFSQQAVSARKCRTELRSKWGLDGDAFVFLFAGKFEQNKRPLDAMLALRRMSGIESGKVALLMVGDGALRPTCEELARKMRLPVRFSGFLNQSEMPIAYAVSDCLLLCSESETWGLVVNEAMACGLPAIVFEEAGCVPDLIIDGKTGYTYPYRDLPALANRMVRLAGDRPRARAFGAAAQQHVHNYSVEHAAKTLLQAIRDVKNFPTY